MKRPILVVSLMVFLAAAVTGAPAPSRASAPAAPPFLLMWGSLGDDIGEFAGNKPRPLDVDRYDNVYVVDWPSSPANADRVQVFDGNGGYLRHFFAAHPDGYAEGLAVDDSGNVLLVNDSCERVEKYDNGGNLLRMWGWGVLNGNAVLQTCTASCLCGIQGDGDGQLHSARGVDTDADGNVYVADRANNRVVKYDGVGAFLRTWGWGVDNGDSAFQVCTSDCRAGTSGNGNGQFWYPHDIAVVGDNVYVAEWFNSRVQIFARDGSYSGKFGTAQFIAGIDIAPNGDIFLSHFYDNNLAQYDSGGTLVEEWGTNGSGIGEFDSPYGVAVGANGDVFVADSNNHRIQKFGTRFRSFKADLLARPETLLPAADRGRR